MNTLLVLGALILGIVMATPDKGVACYTVVDDYDTETTICPDENECFWDYNGLCLRPEDFMDENGYMNLELMDDVGMFD